MQRPCSEEGEGHRYLGAGHCYYVLGLVGDTQREPQQKLKPKKASEAPRKRCLGFFKLGRSQPGQEMIAAKGSRNDSSRPPRWEPPPCTPCSPVDTIE